MRRITLELEGRMADAWIRVCEGRETDEDAACLLEFAQAFMADPDVKARMRAILKRFLSVLK